MRAIDPRLLRRRAPVRTLTGVRRDRACHRSVCVGTSRNTRHRHQSSLLGWRRLSRHHWLLVLLAGLTVMRAALAYLQETAAARASAVVKSQLRQGLMHRVVDAGPSWLSGHRTGEITQLATRGVDALDPYFARYLPQVVLTAIISPLFVVVVWATDWISGLVLVLTLPIVLLFMVLAGLLAQRRTDDQWRTLARMSNHFLDIVDGLTTLRVFGRAHAQRRAVQSVTQEYRRTTMGVLRLSFLSSFVLELFASLSVAIVAVQVGLRLIGGSMELEVALIVLLLAPEAFQPLRTLGASYHAAAEGRSVSGRILDLLDVPRPASDEPHDSRTCRVRCRAGCQCPARRQCDLRACADLFRVGQERSCRTGRPQRLRQVHVARRDARLRQAERRHGLDGRSLGSASRAAELAWPHRLDAATTHTRGGHSRGQRSTRRARRHRRRRCSALWRRLPAMVLTLAGASRKTVPTSPPANANASPSPGAFCVPSAVRDLLLLDEPTAHLDAPTEQRILAAIRQFSVGRFVLMVAHRPSAIDFGDRIIEVGAGLPSGYP